MSDIRSIIERSLVEGIDLETVRPRRDDRLTEYSPVEFATEVTNIVIDAVREAGWDFVHTTDHFIDFTEEGWAIQHTTECRPNMLRCPIHLAANWHEANNAPDWRQSQGKDRRGTFKIALLRPWGEFDSSVPILKLEAV